MRMDNTHRPYLYTDFFSRRNLAIKVSIKFLNQVSEQMQKYCKLKMVAGGHICHKSQLDNEVNIPNKFWINLPQKRYNNKIVTV